MMSKFKKCKVQVRIVYTSMYKTNKFSKGIYLYILLLTRIIFSFTGTVIPYRTDFGVMG